MSKTIKFSKKNGQVLYGGHLYERLQSELNTLANGNYNLTVKKEVKHRSLNQNKWFWLCMTCIEKETGTDRNDAHDFMCTKFLRRKAVINGTEKDVIYGTSKLNTDQFGEFMEKVIAYTGQELGITLPNPEDKNFQDFCDYYERFI